MIPGVVSSNQRIRPFVTSAGRLQPGSTNASTVKSSIAYGNNEYLFHDTTQKDVMSSSEPLSGYVDVVTNDTYAGASATNGGSLAYQNGRYFIPDGTADTIYTSTSLGTGVTMTSVGASDDVRSPTVWFAPASAWFRAGDDGAGNCEIKYSTDGTTWTSITDPYTLRGLGLATDGTRLVSTSEGSTTVAHQIVSTTSTNPASLTWTTASSPFTSTRDVSRLKYHAAKQTWTCTTAQSTIAYSTNGTTWTAKSVLSNNGEANVAWIPWHNRWIAIQDTGQVAISDTSDIAGTWTEENMPAAITSFMGACEDIIVDPKNRYILLGTDDNSIVWSL